MSSEQSAYVSGRNILDGPLVVNEIISWIEKTKKKYFILKVDFDKAFNSISWSYLDDIMGQMGFGVTRRTWIRSILSSSRVSVLVKGSTTKEFFIEKV